MRGAIFWGALDITRHHQLVTLRRATPDDLPRLADLWTERASIQAQFDNRFRPLPDGGARWRQSARAWLADAAMAVLVAERSGHVLGYVVIQTADAPPGYTPERVGEVLEMAVDAHDGHGGIGRALLDGARAWFVEQSLPCALVHVPRRAAIEQAFWRSQRTTQLTDVLWMNL